MTTGTIWPGKKKTFAIEIYSDGEMPNLKVRVTSVTKTNDSNRKIITGTNGSWAVESSGIDIENVFKMTGELKNGTSTFSPLNLGTINGSGQAYHIVEGSQWYPASQSGSTRVFFYTIEFMDAPNTSPSINYYPLYDEYEKTGTNPLAFSLVTSTPASTDSGERFFKENNEGGGNSNCYAGLSLSITGISITAG